MVSQANTRSTTIAAARVSRASLLLGTLGLASTLFVIARLLWCCRRSAEA
jgi:hypothetical protein